MCRAVASTVIIFQVILRISHSRAFSPEAGHYMKSKTSARRTFNLVNEKSFLWRSKHRRSLPGHAWPKSFNASEDIIQQEKVALNENNSGKQNVVIDRQADKSKYGRGIEHLSADLTVGTDVVAYQDGVWYVDGTEVGDGSTNPVVRYLMVDNVQIVWTHDCEHGVIRGFEMMVLQGKHDGEEEGLNEVLEVDHGPLVDLGSKFVVTGEYIELGPEQILARIPTAKVMKGCDDEERETLVALAKFDPDIEVMKEG
mmetsp:Transcript_14663/g.30375  ORF Transcript_14663/g.30375 Transcript_14663/m.30375 type:complete len:255 (-) Transcript_14663:1348-2112(-)